MKNFLYRNDLTVLIQNTNMRITILINIIENVFLRFGMLLVDGTIITFLDMKREVSFKATLPSMGNKLRLWRLLSA